MFCKTIEFAVRKPLLINLMNVITCNGLLIIATNTWPTNGNEKTDYNCPGNW